jgi:hypothetical protein
MSITNLKKYLFRLFSNRFPKVSIENELRNGLNFLDKQTIDEIRQKTLSYRNINGGFCDRAEKSDLYYSLFGMFVGNALQLKNTNENLKKYLQSIDLSTNMEGVNMYCLSILSSITGYDDKNTNGIKKQIKSKFVQNLHKPDYNLFLGILSLYYQKNYFALFKIFRKIQMETAVQLPCPVLAANAVVMKVSGKDTSKIEKKILEFYRGDGSFAALKNSPVGDLLSTAVALFALKFIGSDIRAIKPDCLIFIDSLYHDGSFRATGFDSDTDIEYTFYGMLALGALA